MSGEKAADATREGTDLSRSERLFLRISIWQTVLSVAGIFIAGVALYAALTESDAVRRQTAASVWPYVQLAVNDHLSEADAVFELTLTNAGVGPAHIRAMRVTFGGETKATWAEVVETLGGADGGTFTQSFANNRVLRPGESVAVFGTHAPALVRALQAAVADRANAIEYCYCSIFDACWTVDSRTPNAARTEAAACPDYGAGAFKN